MAGTNEFAFFRCKSICTGGGVQNQAEKKFEKCLPAGTGTKIYFSSGATRKLSESVCFALFADLWLSVTCTNECRKMSTIVLTLFDDF